MDVIHTAIHVSDLQAAREFFIEGLGLTQKRAGTVDGAENVWIGGDHGAVQLQYAPDAEAPTPDRTTIDHLAISVDDVDAETERMVEETGCAVLDEPRTVDAFGVRISFIEGPDGYPIELVEDLS